MILTILGSSSALPTSERYPPAHVLNAHERLFLIDCGEGTQMQMRKNRIRFGKINHIFISHLHGDHVFGLYGLLSTLSLMGRKSPVYLYAPEKFEFMLHSHLSDFDIHLNYEIIFIPLAGKNPLKILDDKYVTVTSFPLEHRVPAFGFIFREKQGDRKILKESITKYNIPIAKMLSVKKGEDFITSSGEVIKNSDITLPASDPLSYAYCSDTKYFPRLASFLKGVTVLYHEATFDKSKNNLAVMTGHSTTINAATVAAEADVKVLIIGHFSARYRESDILVEEAKSLFPNTYAAIDGKSYDLGDI